MRIINTALISLVLLAACSSQSEFLGLADKGVLPLSPSDAFLGANIFLAREMESDPYLYNFVKDRGAPTAIEIDTKSSSAGRLLMYYGRENALYIAQPIVNDRLRQWIVRGPYQIHWKDGRNIRRLAQIAPGDPVLFIQGRYERFGGARSEEPQRVVPVFVPVKPAATPRPKRRATQHAPVIKGPAALAQATPAPAASGMDPKEFHKLNTDQRALLISQGYAPRAENGDIVHTVKSEGENLDLISRWYTSSDKHKGEIASVNGIAADAPLPLGKQIRVPLGLVRQDKAMPKDFR